ncbi:hypothetical protein RF11_01353 [Thelohanellus kitauei]|uniref:Uncharacterized protein n=1 Tax=Thelohanellus kitauei TaxID=669202 RepID=A0A0C2J1R4_THEKT|nr:hypothetical protein RF11_01353 [Thelohanellus kitauei]
MVPMKWNKTVANRARLSLDKTPSDDDNGHLGLAENSNIKESFGEIISKYSSGDVNLKKYYTTIKNNLHMMIPDFDEKVIDDLCIENILKVSSEKKGTVFALKKGEGLTAVKK